MKRPMRSPPLACAGAARQYSGTAGAIALCQVAVTLTYASGRGHALIGRARGSQGRADRRPVLHGPHRPVPPRRPVGHPDRRDRGQPAAAPSPARNAAGPGRLPAPADRRDDRQPALADPLPPPTTCASATCAGTSPPPAAATAPSTPGDSPSWQAASRTPSCAPSPNWALPPSGRPRPSAATPGKKSSMPTPRNKRDTR